MFIFVSWESQGGLMKPRHHASMDLDDCVHLYVIKAGFL